MNLSDYSFDAERGFLPAADPIERLPPEFKALDDLGRDLPKLLVSTQLRPRLEQMPALPIERLSRPPELERVMLLLSYLGHAYIWGSTPVATHLPAGLAVPWCAVARRLGRPPVLSYASYALHNWKRLDPSGPIDLGNIALLQNFLGGIDEEWFILIHVAIEARAGAMLAATIEAQRCVAQNDVAGATRQLEAAAQGLHSIFRVLTRMPEHCDPYIYFHRVRPYIHGWKNNPALPDGLVYEGVEEFAGRGQFFRGETGAQSSIIPCLDALFGIQHAADPLRAYLLEMQDYMPAPHRRLIADLAAGPGLREFVLQQRRDEYALVHAYNDCVNWVSHFRGKHLEYAGAYIHDQSQHDLSNPTSVGTGGTPFMPYLKKHRDESRAHLIT
ncbi:MAG: hypothetical protein FJ271_11370 [Planctomycetes bacterium]|nr:hypothetical protein [Planctomycetota bacterium]